jgi:thiamine biosynthesis lipoprotein
MTGQPAATGRRAWIEQIMGLPVSIHVRAGGDTDRVAAAVAAAFDHLRAVDRMFSTYREDSQISRLNSGQLPVADCDPRVREVLDLCELARQRTGGYFDAMLPGPDGRIRLDPSGLVKGWAVEQAAGLLADRGVVDFCVNAGGDIALRAGPGHPDWRVGVEDPSNLDQLVAVVPLREGAVATSGTARRGVHIVDPHTGRPSAGIASVTVVGPSLTWADVYATAAVARGAGAEAWLASLDGYRALVVPAPGTAG